MKAVKLITSISTVAITLFDILSDTDSVSDIEIDGDEIEIDNNVEVAAGLEGYADIEVDAGSDIEINTCLRTEGAPSTTGALGYADIEVDTDSEFSALDSDDITLPRTPAPFPMPSPGSGRDSSLSAASVESEDSDSDSSPVYSIKPKAYKGPRSEYEYVLPNVSIGSTSTARTIIRRYIGNTISQSGTAGAPAAPLLVLAPGSSGTASNPIDLTVDSEDEDNNDAAEEETEDEADDEADSDDEHF